MELFKDKKNKGGVDKDILIREFLYGLDTEIFIACKNQQIIDEIHESFRNPKFALTLGNSDELACIKETEICYEVFFREKARILKIRGFMAIISMNSN